MNTVLLMQGTAAAACDVGALCDVNSLPSSSVSLENSPLIFQVFRSWLCRYVASSKLHCLIGDFVWTRATDYPNQPQYLFL